MNILLASTSPRRSKLLSCANIKFDTLAVNTDERYLPQELPTDYICRMTRQKMQSAMATLTTKTPTLILTADTIGVLNGQILTKPTDKADAFRMWSLMSGTTHEVWTAVQACLLVDNQVVFDEQILQKTEVKFIVLNENKMEYYWATGEPADKAGAYAIQGFGATWVDTILGSYSNVVGLPLAQVMQVIENAQHFLQTQHQIA